MCAHPQAAIEAAREQAILGHVPAHLIPALASPNTDIINRKITWTLRFPLPASAEGDPQTHRFADLALHASGHRSAAALRNALQLATTTAPPDHEPSNARFIRLPDPTKGHKNAIQNPAAPPSDAIIRWLREGAPRVSSRLFPDPAIRPYCPEALFLFFEVRPRLASERSRTLREQPLTSFFPLQCRTSTRHGRSTTGNCKDCFRKSPWKQNPKQKQHPHNQTNTKTTKKPTPTPKPGGSQAT